MTDPLSRPCTAFKGAHVLASGALVDVALAVKAALAADPATSILIFDDTSGAVIDVDLRGSTAEIVARLSARAASDAPAIGPSFEHESDEKAPARLRGRPRLGVVAREVTLLPRHWEWLATQPGGASQVLRRLVDQARRADGGRNLSRVAQESAYRFMSAMAGDLPGFEEASRALFAGDRVRFAEHAHAWPTDVRIYACKLAWGAPETSGSGDSGT
jgi:uncharacterized protein